MHHHKVHDTYKKAAEAAEMEAAAAAAAEAAAENAEADAAAAAGDGAQAAPEDLVRACREQLCPQCEEKKVADDMRLRMAAEMENFKKRLAREHEEQMRYAAEKILRDMLPRAHFATLYAKPAGIPLVDSFVTELSQDTWVLFPWDSEVQYTKPIIDLQDEGGQK